MNIFENPELERGFVQTQDTPLLTRALGLQVSRNGIEDLAAIERGDYGNDIQSAISKMGMTFGELARTITSATSAFPVRENLEAEAKILVPTETPFRNKLNRVAGAGVSSQFRQITSFGGGWGSSFDQGGGGSAAQVFYSETGAPASVDSSYVNKLYGFKRMGNLGSVGGFAMAAGANFQNQLAIEKRNKLYNLMLNEENALINGSSTSTAAPWGDGTNAWGFDGIINLATTANGVPSAQVVSSVGALTTGAIDSMLKLLWAQGGSGYFMLMNGTDAMSLAHLLEASGTMARYILDNQGKARQGLRVESYVHPVDGSDVEIIVSRFVPQGTIIFGRDALPDGTPLLDVEVLPQVQLPIVPGEPIQGYTARDIPVAVSSIDVFNFAVTVYEVLRLKSALHVGKMTGVTAV